MATITPFIFETARMPGNGANPSGQPVGQTLKGYGEDSRTGYICDTNGNAPSTTVAVSTSTDFTVDNVPEVIDGVTTTYAWTRVDTTTTTTLTNAATRTVTAASNATAGSYVLQCRATNSNFTNTTGANRRDYTLTVTVV